MRDWNAVITFRDCGLKEAFDFFESHGVLQKTNFYNVLTLRTEDPAGLMESLREVMLKSPEALGFLSRCITVTETFSFQTPQEFEAKAGEIVERWSEQLHGKSFHVRMHRRGFKGKLSSKDVEAFLDNLILQRLERLGHAGRITFDDPDAIIAVETVGQEAGLSLWTREDLGRFPFLQLD